jgi:hypothetical protein
MLKHTHRIGVRKQRTKFQILTTIIQHVDVLVLELCFLHYLTALKSTPTQVNSPVRLTKCMNVSRSQSLVTPRSPSYHLSQQVFITSLRY